MSTPDFSPATLKFLRGLPRHNDRDWFEARRAIYETELRAPMLTLIERLNSSLAGFAPEHVRPANKIMMRIYRDTRFAKDKRPYKTHLSAWWARRGMDKTSGGGFYLQIGPQDVLIAAGVYMPEREQLLALRCWMAEHSATYRRAVATLLKPRGGTPAFEAIDSGALKRMPKGFPGDHPAGELLRATNWGVHARLPLASALEAGFAAAVTQRFKRTAGLVAMLNEPLLCSSRDSRTEGRFLF